MKFIGDIVLTTPVIRSVRQAFPDAFIAYMGDKQGVALLEQNPHLNEIIPFDFSRSTILEQTRVAALLRRRKFDLVIDLFGNPRSALLSYLSGAPVRVGPDKKGRGRLYTVRVRDDGVRKTAVEFHNRVLEAAGIPAITRWTELYLADEERKAGRALLATARPVIGMHPGATWPAKKWAPARFAELARALTDELGAEVVVTGGPKEQAVVDEVVRGAAGSARALPVLPLRSLAAVISQCRVYITNDAGPMHIAAALGVPTVGLFGPGEEDIWFPYAASEGHFALRVDVPCHPCHLDVCTRTGDEHMLCMRLLEVPDVLAAARRAFAR